nr:leucine-rich repeat receptor protein kinase EMS1-like [Coffea arabica]
MVSKWRNVLQRIRVLLKDLSSSISHIFGKPNSSLDKLAETSFLLFSCEKSAMNITTTQSLIILLVQLGVRLLDLLYNNVHSQVILVSSFVIHHAVCRKKAISLILVPCLAVSLTLQSDIQVLRNIREAVDPNTVSSTSFLSTWNFDTDPCESSGPHFLGVLCTTPEDNSSSRIAVINLEGDGLDCFLTPTIGNLTELTTLNLRNNNFRGPIPNTIAKLRKITKLLLSQNFFSGGLPEGLSEMKRLKHFDLSQNRLSGTIPPKISALRSLLHLQLSGNQFSGKLPDFSGLWQLTTLDLSSNLFYGTLPQFPTSLRTLLLSHNMISGNVSSIGRLPHLKTLDLSDNRLSGKIEPDILTSPKVSSINVSANLFSDIEVVFMNQPSQLQLLDAHGNHLRGHLPLHLITYQNLRAIYLGHNLFSGWIPKEYGAKLYSWKTLFLEYNFLQGTLPQEFMNNLERIRGSLAHNCLRCPKNVSFCHGGQRAPSECTGQKGEGPWLTKLG